MHGECVATSVDTRYMLNTVCLWIYIKMIRNSNGRSCASLNLKTLSIYTHKTCVRKLSFSVFPQHIESWCVDCYLSCGCGCRWTWIVVVVIRSVRTVICSWINFNTIFAFQYTFFFYIANDKASIVNLIIEYIDSMDAADKEVCFGIFVRLRSKDFCLLFMSEIEFSDDEHFLVHP